ncbi:MAG: carbamoyl-phosphate synthase large subunit, partial [Chloroflexi bacterium]
MPKRTDISSILIIGSGPIVIGQACEFDYSGAQACKALRQEGYRIVLVNSNPATIMTDPEMADATYIEPLTVDILEKIIAAERPDALLPTVGGQTGLNLGVALAEAGILEKYGVELIGANLHSIQVAEDRALFKDAMTAVGLESPRSGVAHSLDEAWRIAEWLGRFPIFIRPSFTMGGSGAGTVFTPDEFAEKVAWGLKESPVHTVLIEESLIGWKEYELEVMRDGADNFVVICTIENLDAMGVHTGDSITVAPAQTLTDKEYQRLRDQARLVMRAVGVETGGSNVQFGVDPASGRVVVIEMNPRVSRSSALASKATGFPIAKFAAKVAVGYTLDELKNDITRQTVAAFEPSIDYVVVKIPRWAFEKFPGVDRVLGPQMKSVGEVMAIGRTFKEALQKGVRGLEIGRDGLGPVVRDENGDLKGFPPGTDLHELLHTPNRDRLFAVYEVLKRGEDAATVCQLTGYDPWFVAQIQEIVAFEKNLKSLDAATLRRAKRLGFSDGQLARIAGERGLGIGDRGSEESAQSPVPSPQSPISESSIRALRISLGVLPTYHQVDTCAAEFVAQTPYLYSSYESESEAPPTNRPKVMILGGGPNRIGQGIEFDYCCVHASYALQEMGFETVMVNCNPETVSTDYDTSDRLYFEPLTLEDVLNIYEREIGDWGLGTGKRPDPRSPIPGPRSPVLGVIVQYGGQTPLNLAAGLQKAGVPILGTQPEAIELAEDRDSFSALLERLEIPAPDHGIARNAAQAVEIAARIGYPVVVRPSYVLGGRAMAVVDDETSLRGYMAEVIHIASELPASAGGLAVLIDHFLEDAYEVDVDAICDGERLVIGGIMQHIEEAGIHSGDSACVLPPYKISGYHLAIIREYTEKLGLALGVRGLMNVQYAIKDDVVYVLEVNPRASRTVPFVSKATGVPLAKLAAQVMAGKTLAEVGLTAEPPVRGFFVKEAVLPWKKFTGIDTILGPEMRSTGEVMGHAAGFGHAFVKSQLGAGFRLPSEGGVLITVNDYDKGAAVKLARDFHRMGFDLYSTAGTGALIDLVGIPVTTLGKATASAAEGIYTTLDAMRDGKIHLIINTPLGPDSRTDGAKIRTLATRMEIPLITTLSAAQAA